MVVILILTCIVTNRSSTITSLVRKSAPIVALYWLLNFLFTYWFINDVLPTLKRQQRNFCWKTRLGELDAKRRFVFGWEWKKENEQLCPSNWRSSLDSWMFPGKRGAFTLRLHRRETLLFALEHWIIPKHQRKIVSGFSSWEQTVVQPQHKVWSVPPTNTTANDSVCDQHPVYSFHCAENISGITRDATCDSSQ